MTPTIKFILIAIEIIAAILLVYFSMKQGTKVKRKYIIGFIILTVAIVISYFLLFR